MNNKEQLYSLLEDYLDGKLSEAEATRLRERIANEEEVAEQFALVRLERELSDLMLDEEIIAKMDQWTEEVRPSTKKRNAGKKWLFLLGISGVIFVIWQMTNKDQLNKNGTSPHNFNRSDTIKKPKDTIKIVAPVDTPYIKRKQPAVKNPDLGPIAANLAQITAKATKPLEAFIAKGSTPRGDTSLSTYDQAYAILSNGDINAAKTLFQKVEQTDTLNYISAQYFLSLIYFEQGDYAAAISIFEQLLKSEHIELVKEDLEWYLALSYLVSNDKEKGLATCQRIANTSKHIKQKDAENFLAKLK